MKNILFFGDSNTWGYNPENGGRYPYDQRWTTVAAKLLGEDYHCVACGLNGRTTVFDDPWKDCRNGKAALDIELQTHKPLDLVVIMLGTNDLKFADASRSARGMETLAAMTLKVNERFSTSSPVFPNGAKLLIISPILINEKSENNEENDLMPDGHGQSKRLAPLYRAAAEKFGAYYMNAAEYAYPSEKDCEHMTVQGHLALGAAAADMIKQIFDEV